MGWRSGCVIAGCQASSNAPDQSKTDLCRKTIADYAWLRDDPASAEAYADLFTEEGTFTLAGNVTQGREALAARHVSANKNTRWRHNMVGTELIEVHGGMTGETRFIIQTGPRSDRPGPAEREIIGYYEDELEVKAGKCLIRARTVHVEFDTHRNVQKD